MRRLCCIVLLYCGALQIPKLPAQCIETDFFLPAEACRNESIPLASYNAYDKITWDFCSGDLNVVPSAESFFQIPDAVGRPALQLVKEGGIWIGFATGTWTNSLQMFEFGNGVDAVPTSFKSFGNLNGQLNNPGSLRMVKDDGVWYAVIHNAGSREIIRVTFTDDLTSILEVMVLISEIGNINSGLAVAQDENTGWVGIISEADNTFAIIPFGDDLNPVPPANILRTSAVPNANNLGDIDLINVCGDWFGAAVNLGGGNVYLLEFGKTIFSLPAIRQIASLSVSNGARLRFAREGNEFFLLVASLDGLWHTLKFGNTVHGTPVIENQGDLNGTLFPQTYALGLAKEGSRWIVLTIAQHNGQVYRVNYELACSAVPSSSVDNETHAKYGLAGTYTISMSAESEGQLFAKSKSISVTEIASPDIDFNTTNICLANDIFFSPVNISPDIQSFKWNFGDLATSTDVNATHRYADAGSYKINLHVTSSNGCQNFIRKELTIYPAPLAAFSFENTLLCTNKVISFKTETPDIYNGNLSYQWFVDDSPQGIERDLDYTFTTLGTKSIKLIASIPGCANEIIKVTSNVQSGPFVDFSFTGTCEDEAFSFQSEFPEPVESFIWDFGNGQTSFHVAPEVQFADALDYSVTLSATNTTGCETIKSKTISVHSKPLISFDAQGPPNTCSGQLTAFDNQSFNPDAREITAWLWEFDDPANTNAATARNAVRTFGDPGIYSVSLTATTEGGCVGSAVKEVVIFPSPSADFTHTPACEDLPVSFSNSSGNVSYAYWEIGTSYYYAQSPTHTFLSPGDYRLYAEFHTLDGCVSTVNETVQVPAPLSPDFSVMKNCVGQEAVFTDITTGVDPVVARLWSFSGGQSSTSNPAAHTYTQQGSQTVNLHVTTQSGCAYQKSRQVQVISPPQAAFTAVPLTGAYPLDVSFVNASSNATSFYWEFMDGSGQTSEVESPVHTFSDEGSFDVRLTAYNPQLCESSTSTTVTTLSPVPDADVESINMIHNADGSSRLVITINNKGNTILRALPLTIDLSGELTLRQTVADPILPGTKYNFISETSIVNPESIRYLCVSLEIDDDANPDGNRMCAEFQNRFFALPAYPNPASDALTIEWISVAAKKVTVALADGLGKKVFSSEVMSAGGLNHQVMDLATLCNGIYFLSIDDGSDRKVQRILIQNAP